MKTLSWDEWDKQYPCLQALRQPESEDVFDSRIEAEHVCEFREMSDDTVYKVVEYKGLFYVLIRDAAEDLVDPTIWKQYHG